VAKRLRITLATLVALGLGVFVSVSGHEQVAGGTLSGTVTDASGAVIPHAQVAITNTATGVTSTAVTDSAGLYTAPNLLPGTYQVTISAPGFATQIQTGITLTVGGQQVLNVTMKVGGTTEKVEVTGQATAVQLANSTISAVVGATTVRELPLNGRSWTDLAALQPGVASIETQPTFTIGADRGNRGFGSEVAISGARPQENNYRLDGISENGYSNGGPGSVLGGNLGVDAVQEFSVLTTNYSAEYGRTSGGVVNGITRSGTNQFHGDVYEFLRNNALDAANYFVNSGGQQNPAFRRNQFGASAGGPIRKDRTFVFGDYEGIRQSKGFPILDTVPSAAARAGNLTSGPITVDPKAAQYLTFYPLPNGAVNGDTGNFTFVQNQIVTENFATARIDHKISEKDSLFGSFLLDRTPFTTPDGLNNVLFGNLTFNQLYTIEETHIFNPGLVNTVRGGFYRNEANVDYGVAAINPAAKDLSLGAVPTRYATQVLISGITPFTGGLNGNPTYFYRWNSFQGYDDAFLTRGTHSVKFGVAFERMQNNVLGLSNPNGVFSFGSLKQFLLNEPKKFNTGIETTLHGRGYRQSLLGFYVQDDWRTRPNLTLNLGLRYEIVTVPTEVRGDLASLVSPTAPTAHLGDPLFNNPTHRNFEPRVGFAWDPFHNGKTAVRGGFGIFDNLPLIHQFTGMEVLAAPFFELGSVNLKSAPLSFFSGAYPLVLAAGPSAFRSAYIEQDMPRNYVMQWNFNIQQQLTPSVTALIGYVGSHGVHMPLRIDEIDMVQPTLTSAGYLFPSPNCTYEANPTQSCVTINPNFGSIRGMFYEGSSIYNALQVGVTKNMSHGLQFQTSFTWGRSIDDSSGTGYADQFANSISSESSFNNSLIRSVSDFNVGRTLVISAMWQVPAAKSLAGPAGWLVNGWQLGTIFKANDGIPFTPTWGTGGDPSGTLSSDDYAYPSLVPGCNATNLNFKKSSTGLPIYVNANCFSVPTAPSLAYWNANCDTISPMFGPNTTPEPYPYCFNLRGNSGRNNMVGPGLTNLDFSIFKNNYIRRISETFNIQFRAEFFNILNHANFAQPELSLGNTDMFDANGNPATTTGGLLTSTTTDSREIQFALKVIW
jgi:Carboxypeptidase regulatory-like domain/TonB dependent receptor-like, beta-barrel